MSAQGVDLRGTFETLVKVPTTSRAECGLLGYKSLLYYQTGHVSPVVVHLSADQEVPGLNPTLGTRNDFSRFHSTKV